MPSPAAVAEAARGASAAVRLGSGRSMGSAVTVASGRRVIDPAGWVFQLSFDAP
jgi:hypothetical protein